MIPKILHQVWIGTEPMPAPFRRMVDEFHVTNPEWEQRLWTNETAAEFGVDLASYQTLAGQANVIRLLALEKYGGIYADVDCEFPRSLNDLTQYAAFGVTESKGRICNGIMGAEANHPFITYQVDRLNEYRRQQPPWGPLLTSRAAKETDVTILPRVTAMPYGYDELWRCDESFPDSYFIHHWMISWKARPGLQRRYRGDRLLPLYDTRRRIYQHLLFDLGGMGCEVGVWNGENAQHLFDDVRPTRLHLVDPWANQPLPNWSHATWEAHLTSMRNTQQRFKKHITDGRVVIHQGHSRNVLAQMRDDSLDWMFIDGDHRYEGCLADLRESDRLVKDTGYIIGHDYVSGDDSPWAKKGHYGVVEAVDQFIAESDWDIFGFTQGTAFDVDAKENPSFILKRRTA